MDPLTPSPERLGDLRARLSALRSLSRKIETASFTDVERSRVHAMMTACEVRIIDLQSRGHDDTDAVERLRDVSDTLARREAVLNAIDTRDAAVFEIFSGEHALLLRERARLQTETSGEDAA